MKRRGFFGALLGLPAAAKALAEPLKCGSCGAPLQASGVCAYCTTIHKMPSVAYESEGAPDHEIMCSAYVCEATPVLWVSAQDRRR